MIGTAQKTSNRTQATRAALVATAEQLFAEYGVDSVSLNEITRAAGQKNRNAVHYHFGSKEGLLQAIFEKHWRPIGAMRRNMLDDLETRDAHQLDDIVAVLVHPVAARFDDKDGGVAYIQISAQLIAANTLQYVEQHVSPGHDANLGDALNKRLVPFLKDLPRPVLDQRLSLITGMLFHGLADHAVHRHSGAADLANTELMVSNLVDAICAVLEAPVSAETLKRLS